MHPFRLRQLPGLYGIRGAIATQTMANLTQDQIDLLDTIIRDVAKDPDLQPDKTEFCKQLGNTIGGDYRSDPSVAENEYNIAIWKATVFLFYHHDYNYSCILCGQNQYTTINSKKQKYFDRQYKVCPHCNKTILNSKAVELIKKSRNYFLIHNNKKVSGPHRYRKEIDNIVSSPIKSILGEKKIDDPYIILEDRVQRNKFYSSWIWNYFKQILNENKIPVHNKRQTEIAGLATEMATMEIISELKRTHNRFFFDESSIPDNKLEILCNTLSLPLEWTPFFISLKKKYMNYDVMINSTECIITIEAINNDVKVIETTVVSEDPIMMLSLSSAPSSNNDNNEGNWSDIIIANAKKPEKHNISLDEEDWIVECKRLLSERAKDIFDIYIQRGDLWNSFSDKFGTRTAAKSHISDFLDISIKSVDKYREEIEAAYQYLGCDNNHNKLPLRDGDLIYVADTCAGLPIAHISTECEFIKYKAKAIIARVMNTRHNYIRLYEYQPIVAACECIKSECACALRA